MLHAHQLRGTYQFILNKQNKKEVRKPKRRRAKLNNNIIEESENEKRNTNSTYEWEKINRRRSIINSLYSIIGVKNIFKKISKNDIL